VDWDSERVANLESEGFGRDLSPFQSGQRRRAAG
jgi:hypothetical protein